MAEKPRLCRQCHAEIGIDDERCERCGARNPVTLPWWGPLLGFAMLGLIAWLLVDFRPLIGLVTQLFQ